MKKCPYCAEADLQDDAKICKHCKSDLTKKQPIGKHHLTMVFHFRNKDEWGWLNAEHTPAVAAQQHFYSQLSQIGNELDITFRETDWIPDSPRDFTCVTVDNVRDASGQNPALVGLNAILTGGASLIGTAIGFYKWFPTSYTLSWINDAIDFQPETQVWNMWFNPKVKEFERMELDPQTNKWSIWRRDPNRKPDWLLANDWDKFPA